MELIFAPAMIWFMEKNGPWVMKNVNLPFCRPVHPVSLLGNVRAGSTKQVASAAGEGATAALLIREHLNAI